MHGWCTERCAGFQGNGCSQLRQINPTKCLSQASLIAISTCNSRPSYYHMDIAVRGKTCTCVWTWLKESGEYSQSKISVAEIFCCCCYFSNPIVKFKRDWSHVKRKKELILSSGSFSCSGERGPTEIEAMTKNSRAQEKAQAVRETKDVFYIHSWARASSEPDFRSETAERQEDIFVD